MYAIDDGVQYEMGVGVLTTGSPDTLSRNTVTSNSAGTTVKLNFAGTCRVYCTIPAEKSVYKDASGILNAGLLALTEPGTGSQTLLVSAPSSANGANIKLLGNGVTTPSKTIRVASGILSVLNDAGGSMLTLSDTGTLTAGQVNASSVVSSGGISGTAISGTSLAATTASISGTITAALFSGGVFNVGQSNGISFTNGTALTLNQSGAVAATGIAINLALTSSNHMVFQYSGGAVGSITTNGSSTAYNTTSDYRSKTLHGLDDGTSLSKVQVHTAAFKTSPDVHQPMILAHELAKSAPFAVRGIQDGVDKNGKPIMQQVDYSALVPALLSYTQALERRLAVLEAR